MYIEALSSEVLGGIVPSAASVSLSAPPRSLDLGDVDLLHRHHRLERAPRLVAAGRERVGQHAGCDLPGKAPAVLRRYRSLWTCSRTG